MRCFESRGFEQRAYELDFAADAWLLFVDVASLDCSDCLDSAQGSFCRSQRSKALTEAEQPFHGSVIALDQIVARLFTICRMLSKCGSYQGLMPRMTRR